jgi:hypothetical protein
MWYRLFYWSRDVFKVRLWVLMLALGIGAVEMAAAQWLGEYLTPPERRWHRDWDGEKWLDVHAGGWPNHPLNPANRSAKR